MCIRDRVFVAPDDPLAAGMVDRFEAAGIPAFGPNAAAAQIESSKVFSKNLMKKYHIPTARYEVFSDPKEAVAYIEKNNQFPIVVKADGLALGKGVLIAANLEEAKDAVKKIMEDLSLIHISHPICNRSRAWRPPSRSLCRMIQTLQNNPSLRQNIQNGGEKAGNII